MDRKILLLVSSTILIALLNACSWGNSASTPAIEGVQWVLAGINSQSPLAEAPVTLRFEEGQVSGNGGCNLYGGSYEVDGASIIFRDLYNTEMDCSTPVGVMAQEREYLTILRNAARIELTGGELTIFSNQEQGLIFEARELAAPVQSTVPVDEAVATAKPSTTPISLPQQGFKEYVDEKAGVSISIPENWHVTGIIEGEYAILQSYPEDKYIGGEARQPGDTKCDLSWRPEGMRVEDVIAQWESDSVTTVISEEEITLANGQPALRFELNSMGPANVLLAELDGRVVTLTCFGDFSLFDDIAATLRSK